MPSVTQHIRLMERQERWIGNGWSSLRFWEALVWNNMPSCWYAFLLGLFFAISGANKIRFVAGGGRKTMYETLVTAKVPFPHMMTYFVSGLEFVGGCLIATGFLLESGLCGFIDRYGCRDLSPPHFPPCLKDFLP